MELEHQQVKVENQDGEKRADIYIHVDPSTVRRKLFQEDSTGNNDNFQEFGSIVTIHDQGTQMGSANWTKDRQHDITAKDVKSSDRKREKDVVILLVSYCKDLNLTHQIEERARLICGNADVCHGFPESALRLCCARKYNAIFLDLNGDNFEHILKLASNIRVSTFSNQATPILALKHLGSLTDEFWRKFGISEIVYGPLYHAVIDKIVEKWISPRREPITYGTDDSDKNRNMAVNGIVTGTKQDDEKESSYQKPNLQSADMNFSKQGWSSRGSSPSPACDSTDQIASFSSSECSNTSAPVQLQESSTYFNDQTSNQISTSYLTGGESSTSTYSTSFCSTLPYPSTARQLQSEALFDNNEAGHACNNGHAEGAKVNSGWIQQILDLHQTGQKASETRPKNVASENANVPVTKTATFQPVASLYQPSSQPFLKTYPGHPMFTTSVIPPNAAYMINGTPGTSNMRISLIPDEYAKHSNKERERRERIKESCDELRKILPKQLVTGRRQDMATILELTVHYLKAVQNHLPTVIQQQMFQSFTTIHEAPVKRKRKSSEITPPMPYLMPHKQRVQSSSSAMHGCPLGTYTGPTYLPQILPANAQQPTSLGYFPSIYHPLISNPYFTTLTPSPSPTAFGNAASHGPHYQFPQLDHSIHPRSQFYNDVAPQSGIPCYMAVSTSSRDTPGNNMQKDVPHQNHHY